jgi:hypothetical protein
MPSLFRYFVFTGGWLLSLLLLINHMYAEPPAPPKAEQPKVTIQHDPRASLVERWRNEQDAKEAIERGEQPPVFYAAAPEEPPAPVAAPSPTLPEAPQNVAPAALKTPPADPEAEVRRKAEQVKAAKARRARIARERAERHRREDAARQQDFIGFGPTRPAYAEGPRQVSPFGWTW